MLEVLCDRLPEKPSLYPDEMTGLLFRELAHR